jgi:hypothetical protein
MRGHWSVFGISHVIDNWIVILWNSATYWTFLWVSRGEERSAFWAGAFSSLAMVTDGSLERVGVRSDESDQNLTPKEFR